MIFTGFLRCQISGSARVLRVALHPPGEILQDVRRSIFHAGSLFFLMWRCARTRNTSRFAPSRHAYGFPIVSFVDFVEFLGGHVCFRTDPDVPIQRTCVAYVYGTRSPLNRKQCSLTARPFVVSSSPYSSFKYTVPINQRVMFTSF